MAGRAAVITLLLGSAILIRLKFPGAFPIDPFFVLIGITYALTVVYGVALKYSEQIPLAGRRAARVRRGDRVGDRLHHQRRVELFLVALHAADHRRQHDQSRRGGMMVGVLSSLLYIGLVLAQYYGTGLLPGVLDYALLPPLRHGRVHGRPERVRVPRRRRAERLPRGKRAPRR